MGKNVGRFKFTTAKILQGGQLLRMVQFVIQYKNILLLPAHTQLGIGNGGQWLLRGSSMVHSSKKKKTLVSMAGHGLQMQRPSGQSRRTYSSHC